MDQRTGWRRYRSNCGEGFERIRWTATLKINANRRAELENKNEWVRGHKWTIADEHQCWKRGTDSNDTHIRDKRQASHWVLLGKRGVLSFYCLSIMPPGKEGRICSRRAPYLSSYTMAVCISALSSTPEATCVLLKYAEPFFLNSFLFFSFLFFSFFLLICLSLI